MWEAYRLNSETTGSQRGQRRRRPQRHPRWTSLPLFRARTGTGSDAAIPVVVLARIISAALTAPISVFPSQQTPPCLGCCGDRLNLPNTCRSNIPSDWRRQASSLPSEVSATVTTMLSPKRSTGFTRPRSSIGEDHGETSKPWSLPRSNGSTGSTTDVFWSPSETYHQPKQRNDITPCWTNQPWPHNLYQTVSGKSGAVHPFIDNSTNHSCGE